MAGAATYEGRQGYPCRFGDTGGRQRRPPGGRIVLKRLLKNSAWGTLGTGTGRILNLLAMILLARSLSLTDFGYFSLIQATLGVLAVFAGAGLGTTGTRYLAEYRHSDLPRAGRIVSLVWSVAFTTVGLVLVLVLLMARVVAKEVADIGDVGTFTIAFAVGGVFLALQVFRSIQDGLLMGLERFRDSAMLRSGEGLAMLALLPALAFRFGLIGALIGQCIAMFCLLLAGQVVVKRAQMQAGIESDWRGSWQERSVLRRFALPSLLSGTMDTPVLWLGIWMLSRQTEGIAQVALYNAAYQWHGPLIFIPMVLCASGMPIMVQSWVEGDLKQFRRVFLILILAAFGVGLLPVLGLIYMREVIMGAYGPEYLAGQGALVFLLLAAPLHATTKIGTAALQSMDRAWAAMGTTLIWVVVYVSTMPVLVQRWGATGLAVSFALSFFMLTVVRSSFVLINVSRVSHHESPTRKFG